MAVPIGNCKDISLRAIDHLKESELLLCEDTRKAKFLIQQLGLSDQVKAKIVSIPGTEEFNTSKLEYYFTHYQNIVFMSDAGTPVINDPGRNLIKIAQQNNFDVIALPGACAPICLWQWSGGFSEPLVVKGFFPKQKSIEHADVKEFFKPLYQGYSLVFFLTKYQIAQLKKCMEFYSWESLESRVGRDMTKAHEELLSGTLSEVLSSLEQRKEQSNRVGELTVLLKSVSKDSGQSTISKEALMEFYGASKKQAAKWLKMNVETDQKISELYEELVAAEHK